MTDWTATREAMLTRLWGLGWTATRIYTALNEETGSTFSRNAILGKASRLGLMTRGSPIKRTRDRAIKIAKPKKPQRLAAKPAASSAATINVKPAEPPIAQQNGHVAAQPAARRVGVTPIRSCAWPLGDPKARDFHFCGAEPVVLGKPYCDFHCRQAYRAPEQKADAAESEAA